MAAGLLAWLLDSTDETRAAVLALAGVIAVLWRTERHRFARLEAHAERCDKRVDQLLLELGRLQALSCSLGSCRERQTVHPVSLEPDAGTAGGAVS